MFLKMLREDIIRFVSQIYGSSVLPGQKITRGEIYARSSFKLMDEREQGEVNSILDDITPPKIINDSLPDGILNQDGREVGKYLVKAIPAMQGTEQAQDFEKAA